MSEYIATVKATLDDSDIGAKIKAIEGKSITLSNFVVNPNSIASSIQNALNSTRFTINNIEIPNLNIARTMQTQGRAAGQQFSQSFNSSMAQVSTRVHTTTQEIRQMQQVLGSMNLGRSSIDAVTRDLESLNIAISRITTRTSGNALNVRVSGIDELGRAVTIVREFDYESGQIVNVGRTISQTFDTGAQAAKTFADTLERANTAMSSGGLEASISAVRAQYEQLGNTGHERLTVIATDITELTTLQNQMANSTSDDTLVDSYNRFNEVLRRVQNNLKVVSNYTREFASETEVLTLQGRIETWLQNNSRAAKAYGSQLTGYINALRNMSTTGNRARSQLNLIAQGFKEVDAAATSAGLKGKTFADKLSGAFSSITRYISSATLIYAAIRAIRSGITTVVELDSALVDLKKTTDATADQLREFYYSSNDIAKQLGVTTKDVIQSAAEWSRLGYSIKDAETMAKTSSIFASISPGMDIDRATEGLVSTLKAYGIEAEDALDGVVSKINAIGNSQALSNADIVEFLTKSSAAMKEANNTLEQTIAIGTAATEITQDASAVGNALKTISMRIRGYDEETEEYVGDIEVLSGKIADLTKTAKTPGGISLFTDETKTTYKSTYELLKDISEIYDDLTDKQQAGLLEALAGKRQGQIIASILNNFGAVEKSLATMQDSAGNAAAEMAIIMDSLEYKINALKETAVGIWQNIFHSESFGTFIDFLTRVLGLIDSLTEKIGFFGTALATISIVKVIKSIS